MLGGSQLIPIGLSIQVAVPHPRGSPGDFHSPMWLFSLGAPHPFLPPHVFGSRLVFDFWLYQFYFLTEILVVRYIIFGNEIPTEF